MATSVVAGFAPSRHGFHFANRWPSAPARTWGLGLVQLGIGDVGRGLCGGMSFAARDRFERGEAAPSDAIAPPPGSALFEEIVDRQFDSFGRLWSVPLRFWLSALASQSQRDAATVRSAWPAIRGELREGRPSMVGLVRTATANPLHLQLGHQVVAYRSEETRSGVSLGVYDPNHPDDDTVEIGFERAGDGSRLRLWQSTGEPVLGLLHLPWVPGPSR